MAAETVDVVARPDQVARTFAVVLNHAAGALLGRMDAAEAVGAEFARHGIVPILIGPEAGDLVARVTLACDSGVDVVVVVGGDGTISCAAQLLAGRDIALGILPSGTMNLLARDLGIPIELAGAVDVLVGGRVRAVDVGAVNGHVFTCGSMTGLPTRLAHIREAGRHGPAWRLWGRFFRATLRFLSAYRPLRLSLAIDGRIRRVRTPAMTVTVNPLSDGAGRQFGRSRLDGGELGVYLFRRLRLWDVLRIGFATAGGRWRGDEAVEELHVSAMTVGTRRPSMRVMNDGEAMLLQMPLRYSVRPGALRVIAP
jgi:diacylglycerol kinase family enzyme